MFFKVSEKLLFNCYSNSGSISQSNKQLKNFYVCGFGGEMSINGHQTLLKCKSAAIQCSHSMVEMYFIQENQNQLTWMFEVKVMPNPL